MKKYLYLLIPFVISFGLTAWGAHTPNISGISFIIHFGGYMILSLIYTIKDMSSDDAKNTDHLIASFLTSIVAVILASAISQPEMMRDSIFVSAASPMVILAIVLGTVIGGMIVAIPYLLWSVYSLVREK